MNKLKELELKFYGILSNSRPENSSFSLSGKGKPLPELPERTSSETYSARVGYRKLENTNGRLHEFTAFLYCPAQAKAGEWLENVKTNISLLPEFDKIGLMSFFEKPLLHEERESATGSYYTISNRLYIVEIEKLALRF